MPQRSGADQQIHVRDKGSQRAQPGALGAEYATDGNIQTNDGEWPQEIGQCPVAMLGIVAVRRSFVEFG